MRAIITKIPFNQVWPWLIEIWSRVTKIRSHVKNDWFSFKMITVHGNKLDLKWTRYNEKLVTLAIKKKVSQSLIAIWLDQIMFRWSAWDAIRKILKQISIWLDQSTKIQHEQSELTEVLKWVFGLKLEFCTIFSCIKLSKFGMKGYKTRILRKLVS